MVRTPMPLMIALVATAACYVENWEGPEHDPQSRHGHCPPAAGAPPPLATDAAGQGRGDGGAGPAACVSGPVDRWKELLIIDTSVVGDPRARNDVRDAPWSFARRLEAIAGGRERAADLAYRWLDQWRTVTAVPATAGLPNAPLVALTPRPSVEEVLLCPWLRASGGNGCSSTCASCVDRRPDLALAPFRLLAIVNRIDLGAAGGPCARDGGELRFVYTAVRPDSRLALPFTIIFEYDIRLPEGQDRRAWAGAWRALGAIPFGAAYNAALAEVIDKGLGWSRLRRVLTNEAALGEPLGMPWELRQFVPVEPSGGGGLLAQTAVTNTPRLSLNDTPELARWIQQNERAVMAGENLLAPDMIAASALLPSADFTWRLPGVDPALSSAFNQNTCSGCHGGPKETADLAFQHIAPASNAQYGEGARGPRARVSRFLDNPGSADELARRAAVLQSTACGDCAAYRAP